MNVTGDRGRCVVLAAVAAVWASSLLLPAVRLAAGPTLSGWTLLARGWQGTEFGVLAWYANPLFLLALVGAVCGAFRAAGALSAASLVLGLTSFASGELARARGLAVPPLSFAAGFYVWLAAQLALTVFCCWCACAVKKRGATDR